MVKQISCYGNKMDTLDLSGSILVKVRWDRPDFFLEYILFSSGLKYINIDPFTTVTANGRTLYTPEGTSEKVSLTLCNFSPIADQTYTGKAIKPNPVLKYGGKTLKKDTDFTVNYSANKDIGTATVTVTGKGDYKDTAKKKFKINPKAVKLSSLTPNTKQLTVKWKKGAGGVSYELWYSVKKNFATHKSITVSRTATVKQVIKGLITGKNYYVRIRAFKKVNGKKYYSAWSKALSKKAG